LRGVSKDVPPSSFETRAKARSSGGGLASIQPLRLRHRLGRLNLRRGLCLDGSRCDSRRCGGYGGLGIGRFGCVAADRCTGSGAGWAANGAGSAARGEAFGIGTEGVRLATLGIDIGGRGAPRTWLIGATAHRTVGHAQVVIGMPSLRYAGMKRMIRPLRALITSRPSSPRRSITAIV